MGRRPSGSHGREPRHTTERRRWLDLSAGARAPGGGRATGTEPLSIGGPAMWGNVNSPLNRQSNNTEVDAKGWLEWAPHEQSAVFTVVITQGGVSGPGSKTFQNPGGTPEKTGRSR